MKTDEKYDVIVVEAGLGGTVAAKRCIEAGLETIILENNSSQGTRCLVDINRILKTYGFEASRNSLWKDGCDGPGAREASTT